MNWILILKHTDTGFFNIDGHKLRDYNSAMENILDIRDKLFALF